MPNLELKQISIGSNVETGNFELSNFEPYKGYFYLAHLDYKVILGKIDNYNDFSKFFNENTKYLQNIRIFNQEKELYIFKKANKLMFRIREDIKKENCELISATETYQILWGTKSEIINNKTRIFEDRGIEIILPFEIKELLSATKRIAIKTRSYIDFNNNQAEYIDSRLCGFYLVNGNNIEKELI